MNKSLYPILLTMIILSCKPAVQPTGHKVTASMDTIYRASKAGSMSVYYATLTLCNQNNSDIYFLAEVMSEFSISDTSSARLIYLAKMYDSLKGAGNDIFMSEFYYQGYNQIPDSYHNGILLSDGYSRGVKFSEVIAPGIAQPGEFTGANTAHLIEKRGCYKIRANQCIKLNIVLTDFSFQRRFFLFKKYVREKAITSADVGLYINFKFTGDKHGDTLHNVFFDIKSDMIDKILLEPE